MADQEFCISEIFCGRERQLCPEEDLNDLLVITGKELGLISS